MCLSWDLRWKSLRVKKLGVTLVRRVAKCVQWFWTKRLETDPDTARVCRVGHTFLSRSALLDWEKKSSHPNTTLVAIWPKRDWPLLMTNPAPDAAATRVHSAAAGCRGSRDCTCQIPTVCKTDPLRVECVYNCGRTVCRPALIFHRKLPLTPYYSPKPSVHLASPALTQPCYSGYRVTRYANLRLMTQK